MFSGGLIFRKEVMKMDIGVSTACLYPLETEKALYELAERGVKNVEIFVNSIDELEGQVLVELRRIIGEYGMNVISMHPFSSPMETLFLFGDYPRRTEYLIDIYKRYFEVMAEIGAGVFVLHGAILSSKVPDERYMERYLRLFRLAKEFGVTVAQENICYCKSSSVRFIEDMIGQLGDEVRFVVDLKQARRSNVDPFRLLDIIGDKVVHLHVSDGNAGCDMENFGGHTYAAGLSMKVENVPAFTERFEEFVSRHILPEQTSAVIDINAEIDFRDITPKFCNDLKKFNPFGPDNTKPVFCTHNVYDYGTSKVVGRDQEHIKLELVDNKSNNVMNGIAFGQSSHVRYIKTKRSFDICYTIEENTHKRGEVQLQIEDIKPN